MAKATLQKLDCGYGFVPEPSSDGCCFFDDPPESDKCDDPVVIFENVELQKVAEVRREGCKIYIKLPETICAACANPCSGDSEIIDESG